MSQAGYADGVPGFNAIYESAERDVLWGGYPYTGHNFKGVIIDSTAADSGSGTTGLLRAGLIVAELDSGAGWVDYDPDATDGSERAKGVLVEECYLLDPSTGAVADRLKRVLVTGPVKANTLINLDAQARAQLRQSGMVFDDDLANGFNLGFARVIQVSGNTTVTAAQNGSLFVVSSGTGATFTLPTPAVGLHYTFCNAVDQDMAVASASSNDDIIGMHDATADSLTFSTGNQKIGACVRVVCIYVGSNLRWFASNLSAGANTITVA